MRNHPLLNNIFPILILLFSFLLIGLSGAWLLVDYYSYIWTDALSIGFIISTVWIILAYYNWYIHSLIKVWQAKTVIGLGFIAVSLVFIYLLLNLSGLTNEEKFLKWLPFLTIFEILGWIILMQWYATQQTIQQEIEETKSKIETSSITEREDKTEVIQNISVKDGTRIHIISIEDIYYIQACGDYVNIFTTDGQYIKELTMKSLEATLPLNFVRIHRSTIINTTQILRIELFGKENYHIRLKNETTLKASLNGYKLLKSRLNF